MSTSAISEKKRIVAHLLQVIFLVWVYRFTIKRPTPRSTPMQASLTRAGWRECWAMTT